MPRRLLLFMALFSQGACLARSTSSQNSEEIETVRFLRDVRPILAEACFRCHGAERQEAGLRLDRREYVFDEARASPLVVPGAPNESLLYQRLISRVRPMPPIESGGGLSRRQLSILRKWIESGAQWIDHWAFAPPERSPLPEVSDLEWAQNPIDAFVRARLDAEGITPSPPADPAVLARRLALDLTGLPPPLEDADEFLRDPSEPALLDWIDRMLASDRAAEHQAREWLDAARYADTHGFHLDLPRTMWAWRDWVIDAFANNLPYDRFLTEQLAGDLLPGAGARERIATGFSRNHHITIEGGVIHEEYRAIYVADRVDTLGTAILGLSLGCARCHDHKYDPITQREYYRLAACFNQTEERGLGSDNGFAPTIQAPSPLQVAEVEAIDREIEALAPRLAGHEADADAWAAEARATLPVTWTQPRSLSLGADGDTRVAEQTDGTITARQQEVRDAFHLELDVLEGTRAFAIEAVPDPTQPAGGPGLGPGGSFVLTEVEGRAGTAPIAWSWAAADRAADGFGAPLAVDGDPTTGWMNASPEAHRLVLTTEPLPAGRVHLRLHFGAGEMRLLGRFRLRASTHALAGWPEDEAELPAFWLRHASDLREEQRRLEILRARRDAKSRAVPTLVMQDRPEKVRTFVLSRGRYDLPGEEVNCGVIETLHRPPDDLPANRLGLATWLVERTHPLTARVAVNRIWQRFFGAGLVRTAEDVGTRGEPPSHPELLDWLAVELIESGWDLRRIIALIATSRTYRQSSVVRPEPAAYDPENRLLWRGPRHRLQAEVIRDQALLASGLLVERLGGPSAFPYQPPGLWEAVNDRPGLFVPYLEDAGEGRWRRSLYTFWKRTVPPPFLSTFDAPDREYTVVRRQTSSTPLQAVALLGEPGMVEAARHLAGRMLDGGAGDLARAITTGFRRVLVRAPSSAELAELTAAHDEQRALFAADPAAADRLLAVGASPAGASHPAIDHAALTQVARIILNLGESLTKE